MGKYIYILSLFFLISSCNGTAHDNMQNATDSLIKKYWTQRIELRDSLYIIYTVQQWTKNNFYFWHNGELDFEMKNDDIRPYVSAVFYSPDKKKMVFCLGEKMPNAYTKKVYSSDRNIDRIDPGGPDTVYDMTPMIGMRDDTGKPWILSVFPGRHTGGYTKEIADRSIAEYLFIEFKDMGQSAIIQSGEHKGEFESRYYGYNIQDKGFWDKCWIWQKDTVGSNNLYPFQEYYFEHNHLFPDRPDYNKCNKCATGLDYPQIKYPKEILDMYGK